MYRIAIGEISHETNTFCPPTTLEMFQKYLWARGEEITQRFRDTRTFLCGMQEAAERLGAVPVPTFAASTNPWGIITREAYDAMLSELLGGIRQAMPLDGVCLALHGAGVAEGISDLESAVLEAVREVVGPQMPIAVTLDLHGNTTPRMAELATGLFSVHEYPHTDMYERGQDAVEFLVRVLRREIHPVTVVEVLPLLAAPAPAGLEPVRSINALCHRWEAEPGMIACALMHGFPYSDIPEAGVTVVAVAERDPELARRAARAVAQETWARREEFVRHYPLPAEAVAEALAADRTPVVINETSDNPGGGAPGDGTHLLRAMLEACVAESAFGMLYDPEVAEAAHQAGVGATLRVRLGGRHDRLHGDPLDLEAYVKSLADGKYMLTALARGVQADYGKTARLTCGGLDVIVASRRGQVLDPGPFLLHGIDVRNCRIVGLKSSAHFRAGYEELAARIITTDPPGLCSSNLAHFAFQNVRRPIYPLEQDAVYRPSEASC
ncbi:MAG: M81 family metallopeptidase [bacterium]|nr:M81 family metallopeptidase [bacterium]